jgi:hypothetical protein
MAEPGGDDDSLNPVNFFLLKNPLLFEDLEPPEPVVFYKPNYDENVGPTDTQASFMDVDSEDVWETSVAETAPTRPQEQPAAAAPQLQIDMYDGEEDDVEPLFAPEVTVIARPDYSSNTSQPSNVVPFSDTGAGESWDTQPTSEYAPVPESQPMPYQEFVYDPPPASPTLFVPADPAVDLAYRASVQAEQLEQIRQINMEREIDQLKGAALTAVRNNTDRRSYEIGNVPSAIIEKIRAVRLYFDAKVQSELTRKQKGQLLLQYLRFEFELGTELYAQTTNKSAIAAHYARSALYSAWTDVAIQNPIRYLETENGRFFVDAVRAQAVQ